MIGVADDVGSPNISGNTDFLTAGETKEHVNASGALFWRWNTVARMMRDSSQQGADILEFDASKSNSVYSGSKLQVPALQLLACIRC